MRPVSLQPLFASLATLSGIGEKNLPRFAKLLSANAAEAELGAQTLRHPVPRLLDLLHFLPYAVIDRRGDFRIADLPAQKPVILEITVDKHRPPPDYAARGGRANIPYKISAHDDSGSLELIFFRAHAEWLQKQLPEGEKRIIAGKAEYFHGMPTISHPDYMVKPAERSLIPVIEPVYPLIAGIGKASLLKALRQALDRLPELPEWLDESLIKREQFPSYAQALRRLHNPQSPEDIEPQSAARRRLAYDELFAGQIALACLRRQNQKQPGKSLPQHGGSGQKLRAALPFTLTQGQEQALAEISADMAAPHAMLRLLQGDVGSGKTAVALLAMAQAAEAKAQAALMAPTEILARQHYAGLAPLLAQAGLRACLLTGREKGKNRAAILAQIAGGEADFIIGTHALFQDDVIYANLALAVIDEQHRFGVGQRLQLLSKGHGLNILLMTATPIPRSLRLTAYGDMDLSTIREKPHGRKPIKTAMISFAKIEAVLNSVRRALARGDKLYWICPLVEESEKLDLTAAQERFAQLREAFGLKVGLLHGKMPAAEKDAVMAQFKAGQIRLLVATTVVEVGVDVPDASIMLIEHAERFGLAQLHQLRGRVGRGDKPSSCTLLYKEPLGKTALARLQALRETEDGFRLAEEDLRLRGEGDILGLRQSGMPASLFADSGKHADLLEMAAKEARLLAGFDNLWQTERGAALQALLYLFRQDKALHLLRSG